PPPHPAPAGFTLLQPPALAASNVIRATAGATIHIVNARISIAPNATNEVGRPHTFTVTVLQDGDREGVRAADLVGGVRGDADPGVDDVDRGAGRGADDVAGGERRGLEQREAGRGRVRRR